MPACSHHVTSSYKWPMYNPTTVDTPQGCSGNPSIRQTAMTTPSWHAQIRVLHLLRFSAFSFSVAYVRLNGTFNKTCVAVALSQNAHRGKRLEQGKALSLSLPKVPSNGGCPLTAQHSRCRELSFPSTPLGAWPRIRGFKCRG